MKTYQAVLAEKNAQGTAPTAHTLHRSSLLFPVRPIGDCTPVVTLSNHFKIKRGIDAVGMRIRGFDQEGRRVFSDHQVLREPRVHRYEIAPHLERLPELATCEVEFYSAANLGMPYPAVLVNHLGRGFHNVVHSFARVLNDVFEDEAINEIRVAEASVDVRVDDERDTFVSFLAGPHPVSEPTLELTVRPPGGQSTTARVPVHAARLSTTTVRLSQAFPGTRLPFGTVLKVKTPAQPMFFGRMIGGCMERGGSAFSANHTYYDHGVVPEYIDAPFGYNLYPLLPSLETTLVFYPIQAPSSLSLSVDYYGERGERLGSGSAQVLESPQGDAAVLHVSKGGPAAARAFRVVARPESGSRLPSRISHQIVIGERGLRGSINDSLEYSQAQSADAPPGKPYLSWIQGVHGDRKVTHMGLTPMRAEQREPVRIDYSVYGEQGMLREDSVLVPPNGAASIESQNLFGSADGPDRYFFVYAHCQTSRMKLFSVVHCTDTGHCSAEHNF